MPQRRLLLVGLLVAAVFYGHTVLLLAAIAPLAALAAGCRAQLVRPAPWIGGAVALATALGLCLPWLLPLLQSRAERIHARATVVSSSRTLPFHSLPTSLRIRLAGIQRISRCNEPAL